VAAVIQFPGPLPGPAPEPNWAVVFELRDRLFLKACDDAWAQRLADERETERARYLPARLRLRLVK
jgi:hypothetical protein